MNILTASYNIFARYVSQNASFIRKSPLYATAFDYDKERKNYKRIFKMVQNKMHWAVHRHTAAELIDDNTTANEIYRLRELKQSKQSKNAECQGIRQRIAEMIDFLSEQSVELLEYDEQLVRRLIVKITVFSDEFTVKFKSGVVINIDL